MNESSKDAVEQKDTKPRNGSGQANLSTGGKVWATFSMKEIAENVKSLRNEFPHGIIKLSFECQGWVQVEHWEIREVFGDSSTKLQEGTSANEKEMEADASCQTWDNHAMEIKYTRSFAPWIGKLGNYLLALLPFVLIIAAFIIVY